MKNMVVLIDSNVIIDYIEKRDGYYEYARAVIKSCFLKEIKGYIAFHSISNIWYVLRHITEEQRRKKLKEICNVLNVTGANHDEVVNALNKTDFKDFEDCLQDRCAVTVKADYIITRNVRDFANADTKAITPEEFLDKIFIK